MALSTATINSPMSIPKNGAFLSPYFMVDYNNTIDLNIPLISAAIGGGGGGGLISFNGRIGAITLLSADVTTALGYTPLANTQSAVITALTFTPMANTSSAVTTALGYTPVNPASAALLNAPTAPTATQGTNNTQIATTAFVQTAVSGSVSGVSSFNTRTGPITLQNTDVTTALGYIPDNPAASSITGGTINGAVIGATTPAAGSFTTLAGTGSAINILSTNGTTLRSAAARALDLGFNVKDFGALGNTQTQNLTLTTTANNNIISCIGFNGTVGQSIIIPTVGISGASLSTNITAVTGTSFTVSIAPSVSVSSAALICFYGTDDSASIAATINAAVSYYNTTGIHRANSIHVYFPPGTYFVKGTQIPVIVQTPIGIQGAGKASTTIVVDPSYSYDLFAWANCRDNSVGNSTLRPIGYNQSTCEVRDFKVIGDLSSTNIISLIAFYDACSFFHVDNIAADYWNGSVISVGIKSYTTTGGSYPSSYITESMFTNIQAFTSGTTTTPVINFGAYAPNGHTDSSNECYFSDIQIFYPQGDGVAFWNGTLGDYGGGFHCFGVRVEYTQVGFSAIRLGDPVVNGAGLYDIQIYGLRIVTTQGTGITITAPTYTITSLVGNGTSIAVGFTNNGPSVPFTVGQSVIISGATPSAYNGTWVITATTQNTLTVTSTATGTYVSGGTLSFASAQVFNCRLNGNFINTNASATCINVTNGNNIEFDIMGLGVASTASNVVIVAPSNPNGYFYFYGAAFTQLAYLSITGANAFTPTYNRWYDTTDAFGGGFSLAAHNNIGTNPVSMGAGGVDLQQNRSATSQTAVGPYSSVLGGKLNAITSTGTNSVVGGQINTVKGAQNLVIGASNTSNTGANNVEIIGTSGLAVSANRRILSGGAIRLAGDSQINDVLLKASTSGTTAIALTADGTGTVSATNIAALTLASNGFRGLADVEIVLSAVDYTTTGNWLIWRVRGAALYYNSGGATTTTYTVGSTTDTGVPSTLSAGTGSSCTVTPSANTTYGGLSLTFTPPSGNTDTWDVTAWIRLTEVT